MKSRSTPLIIPDSPRYWNVDLLGKGVHTFKHPYYGIGSAILILVGSHSIPEDEDHRSPQKKASDLLPLIGLVLGATWCHPLHEIEATLTLSDLSDDTLTTYGNAVAGELQDAEYNILDMMELFGKVMPEMNSRQSLIKMAQARADFISAPEEGLTV